MRRRTRLNYYDSPANVGRRICERREELGMSQRDLSFPGCTAAYISRIERGDRIPSLQLLEQIAARLDVSTAWLAYGETDNRSFSFVIDYQLRLFALDDRFAETVERTRKWLIGKPIEKVAEASPLRAQRLARLAAGETIEGISTLVTRSGKRIAWRFQAHAVYDSNDAYILVSGKPMQ
jgi:transcriptional regulator with XRE-family HTH domain